MPSSKVSIHFLVIGSLAALSMQQFLMAEPLSVSKCCRHCMSSRMHRAISISIILGGVIISVASDSETSE
jgi:hypothetical protein